MMTSRSPYERAMALAALSGSKIALGPAFLSASRRRPGAWAWVAGAMGEMLLDKLGVFPARFRPVLLLPHTLAGAWVAHESLKEDGINDPSGALLGAVVAAGVAGVAPMARIALNTGLGLPDAVLGAAEDYLFLKLGNEATGLTMDDVTDAARDAITQLGDRVKPALPALGVDV